MFQDWMNGLIAGCTILASSEMIKTRVEGLRVQSFDCLASKSDLFIDINNQFRANGAVEMMGI
jgi:hypothetical protein